jgi:hypothetical protein
MNFSLAEIGDLLKMRENPQHARDDLCQRQLTQGVQPQSALLCGTVSSLSTLPGSCRTCPPYAYFFQG